MVRVLSASVVMSVFVVLASSTTAAESVLTHFPEYEPILGPLHSEAESDEPDLGSRGATIDVVSLRLAAREMPGDARYFVLAPEASRWLVRAVVRLYSVPALEVSDIDEASWVVLVGSRGLPSGVVELESIALSTDVMLIRIARS